MREQRKLAAVLAADVVGYSRLMGRDEAGTLTRLKEHRAERLEPALARNGGRLVKLTGDGVLAEFASAVEALRAALEFQQSVDQANTALPEEQRIVFRVGLHVGDLIVDGDDLYGDGVNIAARLEGQAPPGGIVVSGALHEAAAGKLQATFVDLGRLLLKNIERPVQAYRIERGLGMQPGRAPAPSVGDAPLPLPDKPSIAVLPFQNMSGDPEQEYFADGIVEDITTALSRFKSLFVIARNSSFSYKGKSPDVRQVGRELGVRYVLEGSVRKAGHRVRVTGQLVDALRGAHLWADRFEGTLDDVFELQDRVSSSVVGIIAPRLEEAEIERARRRPAGNLQAYDLVLQALVPMRTSRRSELEQAMRLLRRATELDPSYARAFAHLAACSWIFIAQGFAHRDDARVSDLIRLAERALALDPQDSEVVSLAGLIAALPGGDLEGGLGLVEKAMALNPNDAEAFRMGATLNGFLGRVEQVIELQDRSSRLNPAETKWISSNTAYVVGQFVVGQHQAVVDHTAEILRAQPDFGPVMRYQAASLALLGRVEEARKTVRRLLELSPNYTLAVVRRHHEFDLNCAIRNPEAREALYRGLRLAGLPE